MNLPPSLMDDPGLRAVLGALAPVRALVRDAAGVRASGQDANQVQTQEQVPCSTTQAPRPAAKERPACPPGEGRAGRAGGEGAARRGRRQAGWHPPR